jgi:hypothetical protein
LQRSAANVGRCTFYTVRLIRDLVDPTCLHEFHEGLNLLRHVLGLAGTEGRFLTLSY